MKSICSNSVRMGNKQLIDKSLIDRYEVITFDVFDTLLKRQLPNPDDIFSYEERILVHRHGKGFKGFKNQRVQAETKAREKAKRRECTLRQIYEELFQPDDCLIDECIKLEESLELEVSTENTVMHQIYDYCLEQGKRIFYISDMYLSSECIAKLLKNAQYEVYEGQIYVSNEFSANKRSGELFRIFLTHQGIEASKVIHIGDSRYADYIGPSKVGIKAVHIPRYVDNCLYSLKDIRKRNLRLDDGTLKAVINNTNALLSSRIERIGCECFSPIVIGYVLWLKKQARQQRIKKYIFLARDGYLFYLVFKKYCLEVLIDCEYAYISRKSVRLAYFTVIDNYEDICVTFPTQELTIRDILGEIGFEQSEFKEYIRDAGISDSEKFNMRDAALDSRVRKVLSRIHGCIPSKYLDKAQLVVDYMRQVGLFSDSSAAVDIGWHGSLQLMIEKILNKHDASSIPFFYYGILKGSDKRLKNLEYYVYAIKEDNSFDEVSLIYLLERFIPEYVGSAKGYRKADENDVNNVSGNFIEPVLEDVDFSSFTIGRSLQYGCMAGVDAFFRLRLPVSEIQDNVSYCSLLTFAQEPKMEDAVVIGDIEFFDGIQYNMAKPADIKTYIVNPEKFLLDLKKARWREAFFLRLFKIRFPWLKIFAGVKNIYMTKKNYR